MLIAFLSLVFLGIGSPEIVGQQATPETVRNFLVQVLQTHLGATTVTDVQAIAERIDSRGQREPMRIYAQGSKRIRIERGTGTPTFSVVNDGKAWANFSGTTEDLPEHVARQRVTLFPFLDLLAEINNPDLEVAYKETLTWGADTVWHLQIKLRDTHPEQRMLRRPLDEVTDYYVDALTLRVLRSDRTVSTIQNMDLRIPYVQEFSDYRNVNGVAVPFRIVTSEGTPATGLHRWTTVIQSIQINGGLPTNTFDRGGPQ